MRHLSRIFLLGAALTALLVTQAGTLECVSTSFISLTPPQAAGFAHSAVLPSPTKSYDFAGTLIDAPADYLFARATSEDMPYQTANPNVDRSKNVSLIPPGFGTPTSYLPGSGECLTPNLVPGALSGGLVNQVGSVSYSADGDVVYPTVDIGTSKVPSIAFTEVTSSLYYCGGYLGTLKIPSLGLNVKIYEGTDSSQLSKGAGHFTGTSIWAGNVVLAGHNRGVNCCFGDIHTLRTGDTITLTTQLGTRTYAVTSVSKVLETDVSGIAATTNNQITLYTCVRDESAYRWCVTGQAV